MNGTAADVLGTLRYRGSYRLYQAERECVSQSITPEQSPI